MAPKPPQEQPPPKAWPHLALYERVKDAVLAVPAHFKSDTVLGGIRATDLQTLNSLLGATIEDQVVATLNRLRPLWDPDDRYLSYSFRRQAQTFPDVVLRRDTATDATTSDVLLGIELKGWYLLSKEEMPNFRFMTTPDACPPADLLVVVPWALSNVLSGRPVTFGPWLRSSKYIAEYRNYWWQHVRESQDDRTIQPPTGPIVPYSGKEARVADQPAADKGGNFGRIARTGLMDEYVAKALDTELCGIPAREWVRFIKQFKQ